MKRRMPEQFERSQERGKDVTWCERHVVVWKREPQMFRAQILRGNAAPTFAQLNRSFLFRFFR